ncbi:MAG: metallophosphoesterase family protein [Acutalibacteraceae bacterium]|nr:metallophosphoesterase family protein [Oscillospiraceae bacterium]
MKKITSALLTLILAFTLVCPAFAAHDNAAKTLKFNEGGKFRIMMINDYQDFDKSNKRSVEFIEKALDSEKPDLVVLVGDQLSDMFYTANYKKVKTAINNIVSPMQERDIPFLFTFGNHDHDREKAVSLSDQAGFYYSSPNCYADTEGFGAGTYNKLIYSHDGSRVVMNIYMIDTNNKDENGGYSGVTQDQVEWYKAKSDELKTANGGEPLPSLLFQHIPVKEIYELLNKVDSKTEGAVYSMVDHNWYALNPEKMISDTYVMGEAPCSEDLDKVTGQYQAWLEKGDIMGAFFAHDHVNNFVGKTSDGIVMGYNSGTGFATYGNGGNRTVRMFVIDENDVESYETYSVTYDSLTGSSDTKVFMDLLSPVVITKIMKVVYALFGNIIKLFK